MYKTILVPLDGSRRAEAILPHAEEMAMCTKAQVVLMRVIEPTPIVVDPYDPLPAIYETHDVEFQVRQIEGYLTGIEGGLRERGITACHRVVQGPVVDGIIATAENVQADLIAMASHGRSGLSRVFYGSVAAGVLQRVDRPLLLIRARTDGPGE